MKIVGWKEAKNKVILTNYKINKIISLLLIINSEAKIRKNYFHRRYFKKENLF